MSNSGTAPAPPWPADPLSDPDAVERMGAALADRLRGEAISVVAYWGEPEDAVLAHVIARELGVRAVRIYMTEGLMDTSSRIDAGDRAALVAETFRGPNSVSAPCGLFEVHRARVVAVVTVAPSAELGAAHVGDAMVITPSGVDG